MNEKASNRHILDPMLQNANGQGYVFMDQKSWEGFYKRRLKRASPMRMPTSTSPRTARPLRSS